MRILLVEDEVRLTEALVCLLEKKGIQVDVANDGTEGLLYAQKPIYDVIVLDIMLPGINGLDILKTIRREGSKIPVLLLTAKDTVEDRVTGLDLGADDYLPKPFATEELLARIRSLARRVWTGFCSAKLSLGNVSLDINSLALTVFDQTCYLSVKEAQLLELLLRNPGRAFSREQLIDRVWGYDADILTSNVEFYVHHLRRKMGKNAGVEIRTIRNVGYMLKERACV